MRRVIVALSEAVVQAFGPELVVFDTLPYEPLLRTVIERGIPFAVCARKCRDMTAYFDRMTRFLTAARLIVVPHEPGSFAVPKALEPRTHFVGAVRRTAALGHVGDRSSGGPYVLISGGGGGYPSNTQFYNCAIHAFRIVRRTYPALGGVLVTGPLFEDWWNLDVAEGVRVVPFDGDFVCTLSGASVAVCRGGYNTIAEIAGAGIPAICVPAEAKFDDQSERALQLAAGRSGVEVLFTFDPEPMAAAIIRMLSSPSLSPRPNSEQHGADSAASLLLATLA
jgi:predicted glycosyltransferase